MPICIHGVALLPQRKVFVYRPEAASLCVVDMLIPQCSSAATPRRRRRRRRRRRWRRRLDAGTPVAAAGAWRDGPLRRLFHPSRTRASIRPRRPRTRAPRPSVRWYSLRSSRAGRRATPNPADAKRIPIPRLPSASCGRPTRRTTAPRSPPPSPSPRRPSRCTRGVSRIVAVEHLQVHSHAHPLVDPGPGAQPPLRRRDDGVALVGGALAPRDDDRVFGGGAGEADRLGPLTKVTTSCSFSAATPVEVDRVEGVRSACRRRSCSHSSPPEKDVLPSPQTFSVEVPGAREVPHLLPRAAVGVPPADGDVLRPLVPASRGLQADRVDGVAVRRSRRPTRRA